MDFTAAAVTTFTFAGPLVLTPCCRPQYGYTQFRPIGSCLNGPIRLDLVLLLLGVEAVTTLNLGV